MDNIFKVSIKFADGQFMTNKRLISILKDGLEGYGYNPVEDLKSIWPDEYSPENVELNVEKL